MKINKTRFSGTFLLLLASLVFLLSEQVSAGQVIPDDISIQSPLYSAHFESELQSGIAPLNFMYLKGVNI